MVPFSQHLIEEILDRLRFALNLTKNDLNPNAVPEEPIAAVQQEIIAVIDILSDAKKTEKAPANWEAIVSRVSELHATLRALAPVLQKNKQATQPIQPSLASHMGITSTPNEEARPEGIEPSASGVITPQRSA